MEHVSSVVHRVRDILRIANGSWMVQVRCRLLRCIGRGWRHFLLDVIGIVWTMDYGLME